MSGYGDFAAFYDALTTDVDYAAWADYLLDVFDRHGCPRGQLLDLACGSGTLALELTACGVDVIGVDGSQDMLAIAREKAENAGAPVMFLCQDMRELDLYGTVDGAVCMLDSLSHVCDTADVGEILRRLGLFIAPEGLLVFDVNTPYKHREVLGDNAFVFEEDEFLCVWRNRFSEAKCEVSMRLDFFLEEDGVYTRYTDEVKERAYSMATWKKLLAEAGFDLLAVYGERSFEAPTADAERWVFVARNCAINQKNGV
jgi:SAM-dependent methyltransferase